MADPTGTHSDGVLLWGTQILAINSVNYIANDISVDFDTKSITSMNESGVVNKEVLIEEPFTGTCTLQLAAATTPSPPMASNFSVVSINAVSLSCKVSKISPVFKQDGESLVNISFKKKLT